MRTLRFPRHSEERTEPTGAMFATWNPPREKRTYPLCHSERSDSAAEESSRRRIIIIFLRFAGFLGKLGMTYKVGQSKPERALSVLPRHAEERTEPTGAMFATWNLPPRKKTTNPYVILSGATAQP